MDKPLPQEITTNSLELEPEVQSLELLVIHEAANVLVHSLTTEAAIQTILRLLSQLIGLNRGRVVLPDKNGDLNICYAYGLTKEERARGRYHLGEGVTGQVMRSGRGMVIQDIDQEPLYQMRAVSRSTLPQETVAFLAVPIMHQEVPIGVLATHRLRRRQRAFDRDIMLLNIVATFIAYLLTIESLVSEKTANLHQENHALRQQLEKTLHHPHGILGDSSVLKEALQQAIAVAETQATVLLTGESGTGKERFARMIHLASPRQDGPFMAINCAAIPENLLESELFGHEKGAFTGAVALKKGAIELADAGTLFLDEIGDLAFDLQAKLLHVLERQTIKRVGSSKEAPVNVRIIAATHKNLQQAVNHNHFRLDLFYRLNVFPIHLPALRERPGDIPLLVRHFLQTANQEFNRNAQLAPGVLPALEYYTWPGNIRQLENVIKRAVLLTQNGSIDQPLIQQILHRESFIEQHVEAIALPSTKTLPNALPASGRSYHWVKENEKEPLLQALATCKGNQSQAARSLGLTPRQLTYRLKKLGISNPI